MGTRVAYENGHFNRYPNMMREYLESARRVRNDFKLSLRDVETRKGQARVQKICDGCGGMLYYDTGAWAGLYLESLVGREQLINYYKQIPYKGWRDSFASAFGMTLDQFYSKFGKFMKKPIDNQMKLLDKKTNL